jgi:hypothetical protein
VREFAVKQIAPTLALGGRALAGESDLDLARSTIPGSLKQTEAFLETAPHDRTLLESASQGSLEYAFGILLDQLESLPPKEEAKRQALVSRTTAFYDRAFVYAGRALVSQHVQQRLRQIARRRHGLHQPPFGGRASGRFHPAVALRCMHQESLPIGLVLRTVSLVPLRAIGEHEGQLPWFHAFQSISPLAPMAFTTFIATTGRSDFSLGFGRSSSMPPALPLSRTQRDLLE